MSELKTAVAHNLEHGVQPIDSSTPGRAPLSELKQLGLRELITKLLDEGYFASDHELEALLRKTLGVYDPGI